MALIRAEQISGSVASASYASFAVTASYIPGLSDTFKADRIVDSTVQAIVSSTGSIFLIKAGSSNYFVLDQTGSTTLTSNANTVFLIKNFAGNSLLTVSQSGVIVFATQSAELQGFAPVGGIYFTSSSFFVGLD